MMKRSLKTLINYSFETVDGMKGGIKDILLDEERWIIRYLEVSYGGLFEDKRVLIPRVFLDEPDWAMNNFPVKLKKEDIERCPKLEDQATISRAYEEKLSKHYDIEYYWPYGYVSSGAAVYPSRPIKPPVKRFSEKELDTSLRSFNEIEGYHIKATDDKIGHIEDIIVDDEDWQLVYIVVDTSNWLPWSKKVLIPIDYLKDISFVEREVSMNLSKDTIKNAPDYDSSQPVELNYEKDIINFYNSSLVK